MVSNETFIQGISFIKRMGPLHKFCKMHFNSGFQAGSEALDQIFLLRIQGGILLYQGVIILPLSAKTDTSIRFCLIQLCVCIMWLGVDKQKGQNQAKQKCIDVVINIRCCILLLIQLDLSSKNTTAIYTRGCKTVLQLQPECFYGQGKTGCCHDLSLGAHPPQCYSSIGNFTTPYSSQSVVYVSHGFLI